MPLKGVFQPREQLSPIREPILTQQMCTLLCTARKTCPRSVRLEDEEEKELEEEYQQEQEESNELKLTIFKVEFLQQ